jgi:hypothetical protein
MQHTILQDINQHDLYQIEIKLDYELLDDNKTNYRVYTYYFLPESLGISGDSYPKSEFYRDVQNYIRLKTPDLDLRAIAEQADSPLTAIHQIVKTDGWQHGATSKTQLVNNLKLLSDILKTSMREHFLLIYKRIEEAPDGAEIHRIIDNLVELFLAGTETITSRYRVLFGEFNLPGVDPEIFNAYSLTDEYISLLIEEAAIEMYQIVDTYLKNGKWEQFKGQLSTQAEKEIKHRQAMGYGSVLKEGDDNETYVFRASALKTYAASVLFLSTDIHREGRGTEQILYAAAAGLSMIFATVIAFYFQRVYGSLTTPFFAALVVGYMFKDRIKEFARDIFSTKLQERLYDRRTDIRSLDGKYKLGVLREKVSFVQEKDIPKPVLKARNKSLLDDLAIAGDREVVIRHKKDVVLYADAFENVSVDMPSVTGLNDITRYDMRRFLKKMAAPLQDRTHLTNNELTTITTHKVYPLYLISRYRVLEPKAEKGKFHTRARVVLNQMGIKRIDQISV